MPFQAAAGHYSFTLGLDMGESIIGVFMFIIRRGKKVGKGFSWSVSKLYEGGWAFRTFFASYLFGPIKAS